MKRPVVTETATKSTKAAKSEETPVKNAKTAAPAKSTGAKGSQEKAPETTAKAPKTAVKASKKAEPAPEPVKAKKATKEEPKAAPVKLKKTVITHIDTLVEAHVEDGLSEAKIVKAVVKHLKPEPEEVEAYEKAIRSAYAAHQNDTDTDEEEAEETPKKVSKKATEKEQAKAPAKKAAKPAKEEREPHYHVAFDCEDSGGYTLVASETVAGKRYDAFLAELNKRKDLVVDEEAAAPEDEDYTAYATLSRKDGKKLVLVGETYIHTCTKPRCVVKA
jgi:hypothetical protein